MSAHAITGDPRAPLAAAVSDLGLPSWSWILLSVLPALVAVLVALDYDGSLPLGFVVVLLLISVLGAAADQSPRPLPRLPVVVVSIGALAPIVATGGNRAALAIALMVVFRASALMSRVTAIVALLAAVGLTLVAGATDPGLAAEAIVAAGMFLAWAAGAAARHIVELVRSLQAAENRLAEETAREERRRLAREVHDVIAHSMTVTLLHLTGARLALRTEPGSAEVALERAERLGRASLEDLRRTVRLLSDSADPTLGTTIELNDALATLRDDFVEAGATISIRLSGDLESVPPFIGLTVFRIVQESLTNAVRHSNGSRIDVGVDADEERITLSVANTIGKTASLMNGSGRGVHGMFERAALLGGHLEAGPTKDGWIVSGWLPRDVPPGGIDA